MGHYLKGGGGGGGWLPCKPSHSLTSSTVTQDFKTPLLCSHICSFSVYLDKVSHLCIHRTQTHISWIACQPNVSTTASLLDRSNKNKKLKKMSVSTGPSTTKTDTCFPKLHSPVLALKTGLREEISLYDSGARLPKTIPKTS